MLDFVESLPWYWGSFVVVFGAIFFSLLGLYLLRFFVHVGSLKADHDVAGVTFGIIGVIYAVLLTFVVTNVQNNFNDASKNLDSEANIIADLFRDTHNFPEEIRGQVRTILIHYATVVANEEWVDVGTGEVHKPLEGDVTQLFDLWFKVEPHNQTDEAWYRESITKLNELNQLRLLRLFGNQRTLSPIMWTLLILGGWLTLSFMYFFGAQNLISQSIMTAMLAALIAFMLFAIDSLDTSYTGDVRVSSGHFKEVLDLLHKWEKNP